MKGWLVDVCFRSLNHNHLISENEAFVFLCFSAFIHHILVDLFFAVFLMFFTSSPSLPVFAHHVQFQMETRYSEIQKKKKIPKLISVKFILNLIFLSLPSSVPFFCLSLSLHSYPSFCLQSSTRWRWCVLCVTSTLTICMWAGTSPPTTAPLSAERC